MAFERSQRSIPDIFADLMRNAASLVRKEGQLARAEVSEKIGEATTGSAMIVGAAIVIIPALVVLFNAGVSGLTEAGWSTSTASLLVGGLAFVVGAGLGLYGLSFLSAEHLYPKRTIRQAQSAANMTDERVGGFDDLKRTA